MMNDINTLEQAAAALEKHGYQVVTGDNVVYMTIGGKHKPFVAVISQNKKNELVISCQVAKVGDFEEDNFAAVLFSLLDLNTEIRPYAFGILTNLEDPTVEDSIEAFPVVLTDSMPLGDLCECELYSSMDSLLLALQTSKDALKQGLKKQTK
jgi:hypothetical protein